MTIIHCEHCGPTRIAPHDIDCPKRQPEAEVYGRTYPFHVGGKPVQVTVETHPEMFSPIVEKATTHYTVKGRRGAECNCGYNPAIDHPEAGRGRLFAYVGQHIKNESGI